MAELVARLKQRKLVQWALAYVAFAFALIQVLDVVSQRFAWPDQIERVLIIALAIGFFVALVLAWYHGERGAQKISGTELVILALLLAIGGGLLWRMSAAARGPASAVPTVALAAPAKSIAVLAFTDLSPNHDQGYFSDGMSEEILNALAQIDDLKVAGRTSSFYYKGRNEDLRMIGKALGVANILEGSVRKQGDEVRITAQLIRVADDTHLWSHAYDGDLSNVFKLQENIARAITDQLRVTLVGGQKTQLVAVATADPEAHSLYLQAIEAYRTRGGGVQRSIDLYHAALQRDPEFALAWAGLCGSLDVLPYYLPDTDKARLPQIYDEGEAACKRAIALEPDLAAAHIALGGLYANAWHWRDAEQQFRQAQALAPDDPEFLFVYTDWLGAMGRTDEALATAKRAVALDPMAPAFRNLYGYLLLFNDRVDESIAQLEAGRALAPDLLYVDTNLFTAYAKAGRIEDAGKMLGVIHDGLIKRGDSATRIDERMKAAAAVLAIMRQPNDYDAIRRTVPSDQIGISPIFPSHVDDLFADAESIIDIRGSGTDGPVLLRSPLFASYRHDPRYLRLLHKVGFDDNGVPR